MKVPCGPHVDSYCFAAWQNVHVRDQERSAHVTCILESIALAMPLGIYNNQKYTIENDRWGKGGGWAFIGIGSSAKLLGVGRECYQVNFLESTFFNEA